jgi:class 3 adenylate cyclase
MARSVRYAWNGDVSLAYEVTGEAAVDLVLLSCAPTNLDIQREHSRFAEYLDRLARGRRLIATDRRGTGLSDRFSPTEIPPVEALTDDLGCVMDAAGSDQAVIMAEGETAMVAMLFAAAHPDRCAGLVLVSPVASWLHSTETPWMPTLEQWEAEMSETRSRWGTVPPGAISFADEAEREWYLRLVRGTVPPGGLAAEMGRWIRTDVRDILPAIHVPVLILVNAEGTGYGDPRNGRLIADRLPAARLESYQPDTSVFGTDPFRVADAVDSFFDQLGAFDPLLDRVLATVLFTDIVGSTERAVEVGDHRWRHLLEEHHAITRQLLRRWRGQELDVAGDGFFARFDGPARGIRCALDITNEMRQLGIEMRAGLHTGECELVDGKVGGLAVHIGARVAGMAGAGEVLVSRTVRDLVAGSGIQFEERGLSALKGIPGEWELYAAKLPSVP